MNPKSRMFILIAGSVLASHAHAALHEVKLNFDRSLPFPRNQTTATVSVAPAKGSIALALFEARKSKDAKKWAQCVRQLNAVQSRAAIVSNWVDAETLICLREQVSIPKGMAAYAKKLQDLNLPAAQQGPSAVRLRQEALRGWWLVLEENKKNPRARALAFQALDQIFQFRDSLGKSDLLRAHQEAAELAKASGAANLAREHERRAALLLEKIPLPAPEVEKPTETAPTSPPELNDYQKGRQSLFAGDLKQAEDFFSSWLRTDRRDNTRDESLVRLGLLRYRAGDKAAAATHFERLLGEAPKSDWNVTAKYWLWQSQKDLQPEAARKVAEDLVENHPLTYYALRARLELHPEKKLEFPVQSQIESMSLHLLPSEFQAWKRFELLLASGWWDEARLEMATLPWLPDSLSSLHRARLLGNAYDHHAAFEIYARLMESAPQTFLDRRVVSFLSPREHGPLVLAQSKALELPPEVMWAVMKQESAFRERAQSVAGARGVMQLVPPTAREAARDLKMKNVDFPDGLFDPLVNIRLGSYYLKKMLRSFSGHLPLSLAAYNVGMGRVRRWLTGRPDLAQLATSRTSAPDQELWIEEMPWSETVFYVKAVMRNVLLYRYVHSGRVEVKDPLW